MPKKIAVYVPLTKPSLKLRQTTISPPKLSRDLPLQFLQDHSPCEVVYLRYRGLDVTGPRGYTCAVDGEQHVITGQHDTWVCRERKAVYVAAVSGLTWAKEGNASLIGVDGVRG